MIFLVKFWTVCVIFGIMTVKAQALKCYQCEELDEDLERLSRLSGFSSSERNSCSYKIWQGLATLCPPRRKSNVCVRIVGNTLNGSVFERRFCGQTHQMTSLDECKSLLDVDPEILNKLKSKKHPLASHLSSESLKICFCSTDQCNVTAMTYPSLYLTICVMFAYLILIFQH